MRPDASASDSGPDTILDQILRQIAEQVAFTRASAWARSLLERGEAVVGVTSTPPTEPPTTLIRLKRFVSAGMGNVKFAGMAEVITNPTSRDNR